MLVLLLHCLDLLRLQGPLLRCDFVEAILLL
jgi:hypothetical protein